jgi:SurA N-terminal domain/PPIC-type PPIASE domain
MLQRLRDRFPRWLVLLILSLLALLFAFLGLYNQQAPAGHTDAVLARVGKQSIRQIDLEVRYAQLKQQQGADFQLTPAAESRLREQALSQLILTAAMSQQARQRGYRVSQADLVSALHQMPLFQTNGKFSLQYFREVITAAGYTEQAFLATLKDSILINQVQEGILNSTFILAKEVEIFIRLINQQRDFQYTVISANQFEQQTQPISREAALAYYQQHSAQFFAPEQVSLDYIELSLSTIMEGLRTSHPDWPRQRLQAQAEKQFLEIEDSLTQLSDQYPASLEETAQTLGLSVQSTSLFIRTTGDTPLTQNSQVIDAAFSEAMLQGYNSPVLHLAGDKRLLLRVKAYQAAGPQAFEGVYETIQAQIKKQQAAQKAQALGEKWLQQRKPSEFPQTWQVIRSALRTHETTIPPAIINSVFKMPRPTDSNLMPMTGLSLPNGDYAIIHLQAVRDGTVKTVKAEQLANYQAALATVRGQLDYTGYTREALNEQVGDRFYRFLSHLNKRFIFEFIKEL